MADEKVIQAVTGLTDEDSHALVVTMPLQLVLHS